VLGLVVIVLALIVGGMAWYMRGRPLPAILQSLNIGTMSTTPGDENAGGAVTGPELPDTRSSSPRRRTPARVENAETEMLRARELFQREDYAAAGVAFDRVVELLGPETSPQADELTQLAKSLAEVARAAVVASATAATAEYRPGDAGVTEPVPLAYLPPKPDPKTPPDQLQVLEVHVNATGTVDSAKFVMNRPSFRNSWWTAAAKAWRFTPATKDGRPVRYVMRIVMDDSAADR
jgi:hypothetical protein